jgi:HD-like signal output (HDOD) protein/ActR/RegA family two-component response regulator
MSDKLDFAELKASGALPSPKGVALTVMQLCQRDNVSLPELAHTIQADPVLAGRIIKIANTANPNKSRPIASVTTDTLILIGIHAVRQVVLGFSLLTSYQQGACKAFDYTRYWARSVGMASAAQAIGAAIRIAPPAEMFTCGLLSGIGQLGLAAVRPEAYSALLQANTGKSIDEIAAAEFEQFSMNHRTLSSEMMADWGIPRLFIDAVAFHENPENSGFSEGSRQRKLTYTLQLAALLADIFVSAESAREDLLARLFRLGSALDIAAGQLVDIANQTMREWNDWCKLLEIRAVALPPFTIPEDLAQAATTTNVLSGQLASSTMRILIAAHDETITLAIGKILSVAGHKVLTAKTSRQAFEAVAHDKPQVVFADWSMPELDAVALCKAIRAETWGHDLFFVVLTAHEDDQELIDALEAGADAYLKKPVNPRLLNAKLMVAERRLKRL